MLTMPNHPLLSRMYPDKYPKEPDALSEGYGTTHHKCSVEGCSRGQYHSGDHDDSRSDTQGYSGSRTQSSSHLLIRKSPFVERAERNELPAKDTTNG